MATPPAEDAAVDSAAIEEFVIRECTLSQQGRYREWLELWDDEGLYWVPIGDPTSPDDVEVAIVRDNLPELKQRVERLESGLVHAQNPPSRWTRVLGPIMVDAEDAGDGWWQASVNFHALEYRPGWMEHWAGMNEYLIRPGAGGLRILRKTVWLVNRDEPLRPLLILL